MNVAAEIIVRMSLVKWLLILLVIFLLALIRVSPDAPIDREEAA